MSHLHVHVLPRWGDDAVGDIWPPSPRWADTELTSTQESIARLVEASAAPGYDLTNSNDREDRRKHLEMVAAAISRMANSSAAAKGWAVALAGLAFGTALVRDSWPLLALGILVVLALGLLDARYLETERHARGHFNAIADDNTVAPFSMKALATSSTQSRWWWPARFRSWSIGISTVRFFSLVSPCSSSRRSDSPTISVEHPQPGHHHGSR